MYHNLTEQIQNASNELFTAVGKGRRPHESDDFINSKKLIHLNRVRVYCSGRLLFHHTTYGNHIRRLEAGNKREITMYTERTGRRMRKYLRECEAEYTGFITLTYPEGHGYIAGQAKRDLDALVKRIKRKHPNPNLSLFWFMEFHQKGNIHFHIFTNHWIDKQWLSNAWYFVVGSDDERHLQSGTRVESFKTKRGGTITYASKYAAKHEQKAVPDSFGWIGRFWGVYGVRRRVVASTEISLDHALKPRISDKIREYDEFVRECLRKGKLIPSDVVREGVQMMKIADQSTQFNLQYRINAIEIQIRLERGSDWDYDEMPELRIDYA